MNRRTRQMSALVMIGCIALLMMFCGPGVTPGDEKSESSDASADGVVQQEQANTPDRRAPNSDKDVSTPEQANEQGNVTDRPGTDSNPPEPSNDRANPPSDKGTPPPDDRQPPSDKGNPPPDRRPPPSQGKCGAGPQVKGDVGPTPSGNFVEITCLEVRNDRSIPRNGEVAFSSIPIPRSLSLLDTKNLAIVGPGERRLQAQFWPAARWGGALQDTQQPIRWLQVSVQADVLANSTSVYSLRRYNTLNPAKDTRALQVQSSGQKTIVQNQVMRVTLNPGNPALFEQIQVRDSGNKLQTLHQYASGAGPKLILSDGTVLSTKTNNLSVDKDGFTIMERGPVKVVVRMRGHFKHPTHKDVNAQCDGNKKYERFGYTVYATFYRGSSSIGLQYHFRNECGEAEQTPWTNGAVKIRQTSWELPLKLTASTVYAAGTGKIFSGTNATNLTLVEQQKGGEGSAWKSRKSRVSVAGKSVETGKSVEGPLVGVYGSGFLATLQMPWMRYREPQALAVQQSTLSARFVSGPLLIGEAKAIWNFVLLQFLPSGSTPSAAQVERSRKEGLAQLERGLLVRVPVAFFNQSKIYPTLGDATKKSLVKTQYRKTMEKLHQDTIKPGGQWDVAKTFGSQIWPDIGFDVYGWQNTKNPYEHSPRHNYWNPSGAELMEFFRTGDPKWVWDFAMPQSYLQMFTAYYNTGERTHGNPVHRGFAVTSGGDKEGQWHRSGQGSNDYSYNQGMDEAYLIRPNWGFVDRFRVSGLAMEENFDLPFAKQSSRSQYVNELSIIRLIIQKLEMMVNCAEYVPGAAGTKCKARMLTIMKEFATDNFKQGVMCQDDIISKTSCINPQNFMIHAMMLPFFVRHILNYNNEPNLRSGISEWVRWYYNAGISKTSNGKDIDIEGDWWAGMTCTFNANGTKVASCKKDTTITENQGVILNPNRPHTFATLGIGHTFNPKLKLCAIIKKALDQKTLYRNLDDEAIKGGGGGWYKPTSQMMQGMIFAVGFYDQCKD